MHQEINAPFMTKNVDFAFFFHGHIRDILTKTLSETLIRTLNFWLAVFLIETMALKD